MDGRVYEAEPSEITLESQQCPPFPEGSPSVYRLPEGSGLLDNVAVEQYLQAPLAGTNLSVPPATVDRLYELSGGQPEVVQQLATEMLRRAQSEKRPVLTPHDSYAAARALLPVGSQLLQA
jgi:hypothetical protein